jgi:hypothetical protein
MAVFIAATGLEQLTLLFDVEQRKVYPLSDQLGFWRSTSSLTLHLIDPGFRYQLEQVKPL